MSNLTMNAQMSLYKIADATQIPLTLTDGVISGAAKIRVELAVGLSIPLQMTAIKIFQDGNHVGVLFHVRKDFYVIVAHYQAKGAVSMFFVDKSKLKQGSPENIIGKNMGLKAVVDALSTSVVQAHYYQNGSWKKMVLAS